MKVGLKFNVFVICLMQTAPSCNPNSSSRLTTFSSETSERISQNTSSGDGNDGAEALVKALGGEGFESPAWINAFQNLDLSPAELPSFFFNDIVPNLFRDTAIPLSKSCVEGPEGTTVTFSGQKGLSITQNRTQYARSLERNRSFFQKSRWSKPNMHIRCDSSQDAVLPWNSPIGLTQQLEMQQTSDFKLSSKSLSGAQQGLFEGLATIDSFRTTRFIDFKQDFDQLTVTRTRLVEGNFRRTIRSKSDESLYEVTEIKTLEGKPIVLDIVRSTNPMEIIKEISRTLRSGGISLQVIDGMPDEKGRITFEYQDIIVKLDRALKKYIAISGRFIAEYFGTDAG